MTIPHDISLMAYFGMGPVQQVAKKRLFGEPYLRFADFVGVAAYLHQSGALLGHAKLDHLVDLAKMVTKPGREADMIYWAHEAAKHRLEEYVGTFGQEPKSLMLYVFATEYRKAGITMPFGGLGELTDTLLKQVAEVAKVKMPLKDVEPIIKDSMLEGIGFGSLFPDLMEQMFRESHEYIGVEEKEEWSDLGLHFINTSVSPTFMTLEEQERIALEGVATYAQTYFPELIEPLNLTDVFNQLGPECT